MSTALVALRQPAHQIELVVWAHRRDVGHAVRQREERRDRRDVPGVVIGKAVFGKRREVALGNLLGLAAHLHREIEQPDQDRKDELQDSVYDKCDSDKRNDNHVVKAAAEAAFVSPCRIMIIGHGVTVPG